MNDCDASAKASLEKSRLNRAFLILAAICVSLMPSVYKGGAEVPHAHSFFQFWLSGPESAFDHHHAGHDHDADHGEAHDHPTVSTTMDGHPVTGEISRDVAAISPVSVPGGVIDVLVLASLVAATFAIVLVARWRFPRFFAAYSEFRLLVEPPPPKFVLA